jgi:dihydroorotase
MKPTDAAMNRYDLLLKCGEVVDPVQSLHAVMDVAIQGGRIAALRKEIPACEAKTVIEVAGRVVMPGLVDLHTHVYWGGTALGVQPDRVAAESGVTAFVDAGSAGAANFLGFKEHVIDRSKARIWAFLHISFAGLAAAMYDPERMVILGETFDIQCAMPGPAVELGKAYPALIRGIKVRLSLETSGDQGVEPLRLAQQAADALDKPVMVHIGVPPPTRREVLSLLRPGDILTHVFRGEPNSPLDRHGKVLPEMLAAREAGVVMDTGHGAGSFSWPVAKEMLEQGFYPDVISSDIHTGLRAKTNSWSGMPAQNMPTTLSKFLSLGMSLNDVVRASTTNPARVIGCEGLLGSLCKGSVADIAVFRLEEGEFEYNDSFSGKTVGNRRLVPCFTVLNGEILQREGVNEDC